MSNHIDFRLDWAESAPNPIEREDRWTGVGEVEVEHHQIQPLSLAPYTEPSAAFESSEARAQAIDAALMRVGPSSASRVCQRLAELAEHPSPERLDAVEHWLRAQLLVWSRPVQDCEPFNQSLLAACDGLHLALELVALLRAEQLDLIPALLKLVDQHFQAARGWLLQAEPGGPAGL